MKNFINKIQNYNCDPLRDNNKLYMTNQDYQEWKQFFIDTIQTTNDICVNIDIPITQFIKTLDNVLGYGINPELTFKRCYKYFNNKFFHYSHIYRNRNAFIATMLYLPGINIYHVTYKNQRMYIICWKNKYHKYLNHKNYYNI